MALPSARLDSPERCCFVPVTTFRGPKLLVNGIGNRAGPVTFHERDVSAHSSADRGARLWADDFVREFVCFGRVASIYPATHGRVVLQEERLAQLIDELATVAPQGITLKAGETILVDDEPTSSRAADRLASDLRPRGVLAIRMLPGTTTEEVVSLAKCLGTPLHALRKGGGVRALLDAAGLRRIEVELDAALCGDDEIRDQEIVEPADEEREPEDSVEDESNALDRDGWRASINGHDSSQNAIRALCNLLPAARSAREYEARRNLLFRAAKRGELDRRKVCKALSELHSSDVPMPFEKTVSVALELAAETTDARLIKRAVTGQLDEYEARSIAIRLTSHPDSFSLLSFLACSELPGGQQRVFGRQLRNAARRSPGRFENWAMAHTAEFLQRRVTRLFVEKASAVVGPVAKHLLLEGTDDDRRMLIDQLVEERTEAALRILALGLPYGSEPRDTYLIEALGSFSHPLANLLLREVVHRCNTERFRPEEAKAAVRALVRSPDIDSREFLHEVCRRRSSFFFSYRRQLRRLAVTGLLKEVA